MTHVEIGQIWEQWMSPFVQRSKHSPQHTRQVASKRTEQDGEHPSLLHKVSEQLEEGGQDPVVKPTILPLHRQLSVFLQREKSQT